MLYRSLIVVMATTWTVLACGAFAEPVDDQPPPPQQTEPAPQRIEGAEAFLRAMMDRFHTTFDVYTDADAGGNHFASRGKLSSPGGESAVEPMDERFTGNPYRGLTSTRAILRARGSNWGGWYWLNGVLRGAATSPVENWGDIADAGVNLSGATSLSFHARGARGGEKIEFFAFGVGRGVMPHPDGSNKISTGLVTLSTQWQRFQIDVTRAEDLSYVLGGFGFVAAAQDNGNQDVEIYLDDIRYELRRTNEPRFLLSFETTNEHETFDIVTRNVSFGYDNAMAALAWLAIGDTQRAGMIADAFLFAMEHDRTFTDRRLRNAYQAGDLAAAPGWEPNGRRGTVRMPGWSDRNGRWFEDEFHVSTHTGNIAWPMIALISYFEATGRTQTKYLDAARMLGDWVVSCCTDSRGSGGFLGGFAGRDPSPVPLGYKATEHNLDLYVAFERLAGLTQDPAWHQRATDARRFVLSMWDQTEGKFWSSAAAADGATPERGVVPLDAQAWALLAFRDSDPQHRRALQYVERALRVGQGYDFSNTDRDGTWWEGTAQMAAAYALTREDAAWSTLITNMRSALGPNGGVYAADRDRLSTGFRLPDNSDWLYFRREHVGATAWAILAAARVNPFWIGRQ